MTSDTAPNAILHGGPSEYLPDDRRLRHVAEPQDVLKVLCGNRYEHFRRSARTVRHESLELRVFAWTGFTYLAE